MFEMNNPAPPSFGEFWERFCSLVVRFRTWCMELALRVGIYLQGGHDTS